MSRSTQTPSWTRLSFNFNDSVQEFYTVSYKWLLKLQLEKEDAAAEVSRASRLCVASYFPKLGPAHNQHKITLKIRVWLHTMQLDSQYSTPRSILLSTTDQDPYRPNLYVIRRTLRYCFNFNSFRHPFTCKLCHAKDLFWTQGTLLVTSWPVGLHHRRLKERSNFLHRCVFLASCYPHLS